MCHRRPRWGLHRPVRTLGDSFILFFHPPQGKTKCKRISPTPLRRKNSTPSRFCGFRQSTAMRGDHGLLKPCQHGNDDRIAVLFFLCYDERRTRSRAFPGYRVTIGNQTGQEKKMLNDLAEQYFHEKNVDKRRAILKNLVFKCESCSKEFFEKAFKKERKLDLKLLDYSFIMLK